MALPPAIERLIREFSRFPGVGRRSAERMALDLVQAPAERTQALLGALEEASSAIVLCPKCGYFTEGDVCTLCGPQRDGTMMIVVERPLEVLALERMGGHRGLYHVLGGHLSPLKGIAPEDLRLAELEHRLEEHPVKELILATSSSVEGDATALFLARHLEREGLRITRLGRGVPMGGNLEHTDAGTLRSALESRRSLSE